MITMHNIGTIQFEKAVERVAKKLDISHEQARKWLLRNEFKDQASLSSIDLDRKIGVELERRRKRRLAALLASVPQAEKEEDELSL